MKVPTLRSVVLAAMLLWDLCAPVPARAQVRYPFRVITVPSQKRFDFHISYWLNLHHTLYEQARRQEQRKKEGAASKVVDLVDTGRLKPTERETWQAALDYYAAEVISRDLLFDETLTAYKLALAKLGDRDSPVEISPLAGLAQALRRVTRIYDDHWWQEHYDACAEFAGRVELEASKFLDLPEELEKFFQAKFPQERLRVDVVRHANWAGAYTTSEPQPHITIASSDPRQEGDLAIEVLFHEASHLLVEPDRGAIGAGLAREAATQKKAIPRDLWHVILFYTVGERTKQRLADLGRPGFQPYAYRHGLYQRAWPGLIQPLEQHWQPYLEGKSTLEEALRRVVRALP